MMLDRFLPSGDFISRNEAILDATPAAVYAALRKVDLSRVWWVGVLFRVRTLFEHQLTLGRSKSSNSDHKGLTIDAFVSGGDFIILGEEPDSEIVVGSVGKFWMPAIPFAEVSPETFTDPTPPGWGKLAWNARVVDAAEGRTRLTIEVRVSVPGLARARFARYWWLIEPFSHAIRERAISLVRSDLKKARERRALPGDELVGRAIGELQHEIVIAAAPRDVWPWLVQMGCRRAGWYSYDLLDNRGRASADRIVPELQALAPGDRIPARPNDEEGYWVALVEPLHALVLATHIDVETGRSLPLDAPSPSRYWRSSWAFVLEPLSGGRTRLLTRARARFSMSWPFELLVRRLAPPIHFVMQRKQLRGIKRRAEALRRSRAESCARASPDLEPASRGPVTSSPESAH